MTKTLSKKTWERLGLAAILGGIVAGFVVMVVLLVSFRTSEEYHKIQEHRKADRAAAIAAAQAQANESANTSPPPVAENTGELANASVPAPVRTRESLRNYNRPLAVHSLDQYVPKSTATGLEEFSHSIMVPDLPSESEATGPGALMNQMPVAAPVVRSNPRNSEENGEKKDASGWGWLADDMKSSREARAQEEKQAADESEGENPRSPTAGNAQVRFGEIQAEGRDLYFSKSPLQAVTRDEVAERAAKDNASPSTKTGYESDFADTEDRLKRPVLDAEKTARDFDPSTSGRAAEASRLEVRDPFARSAEWSNARMSGETWGNTRRSDISFEAREAGDSATRATGGREGLGLLGDNASRTMDMYSRLSGSGSGDDPSRREASAAGYASDGFFHAGAGYSPASGGVSYQNDGLFNAGGSLSGGSVFESDFSAPAMGGGSSQIGGVLPSPSVPAAWGGSRTAGDPQKPSALPW
jgi:hypothetical protein